VVEFTFGLLSFWFEEVWVFRQIFAFCAILFSGAFIPLELFPSALQGAIAWTPFPFLTSVPVHIFLGDASVSLILATLTLGCWIVGLSLVSAVVWRRGIGLYTAAGI